MRCLIIDDEYLARVLISDYVSKLPYLKLVAICKNASEAMEILEKEPIDLMFLDIQMPQLTGMDFVKSLNNKPLTIFTTAYPEYAIDSYELDIIDYLLKPISFERFLLSVKKAQQQFKLIQKTEQKNYITIKSEHRLYKVLFQDILYIEGLKEYLSFYTKQGKRIITLESLKALEQKLPDNFTRIHRSYIVNRNEVKSLYG
ncbi:MAG: DNA-binding response regulator, partial [Bacteroidetes bacterium 4572_77]